MRSQKTDQASQPELLRHHGLFRRFAAHSATVMGSQWAFCAAVLLIVVWAVSYKMWQSFDTWQLVINTSTTIVTFLMVFVIQNTQNRDARALHLKLDELLRAMHGARDSLIDLESLSDKELDKLGLDFKRVRDKKIHGEPAASDPDESADSRPRV